MARGPVVAIDGPAGAGKSTVCKGLARALGWVAVNTGALLPSLALAADRRGIECTDEAGLCELIPILDVRFEVEGDRDLVMLGDEDVSEAIRDPRVSMLTSKVSALPGVRAGLLDLQRRSVGMKGAVLEGRDIGTVVFPDAENKFFLDASATERARRRVAQLEEAGHEASFEQILESIRTRDRQDSERDVAPLRAAADAVVVDSSELSAEQVVARMLEVVQGRQAGQQTA